MQQLNGSFYKYQVLVQYAPICSLQPQCGRGWEGGGDEGDTLPFHPHIVKADVSNVGDTLCHAALQDKPESLRRTTRETRGRDNEYEGGRVITDITAAVRYGFHIPF